MNKPDGSAIIRIVGGSDSEEWEPTPEQIDVIVSAYTAAEEDDGAFLQKVLK